VAETSLNRDRINVLLLEGVHESAVDSLKSAGYVNIEQHKSALQGDALAEALNGVHLLGIRSRTQLDATALAHADRLIAVGCFCIVRWIYRHPLLAGYPCSTHRFQIHVQ